MSIIINPLTGKKIKEKSVTYNKYINSGKLIEIRDYKGKLIKLNIANNINLIPFDRDIPIQSDLIIPVKQVKNKNLFDVKLQPFTYY